MGIWTQMRHLRIEKFEVDQNVLLEVRNICETHLIRTFFGGSLSRKSLSIIGLELYVNQPSGFDMCLFWDVKEQDITLISTAFLSIKYLL